VRYLLLFLFACGITAHGQPDNQAYVVLVSFDGFRHDYAEKYDLPNFKSFIKKGASADALIPAFPSKTFPNHYTLVTGLYPGSHGLVDNSFFDETMKARYTMSNRSLVENPLFYGGTPLWQLAQQQGLRAASCFWVGSEVPVMGEYPTYYYKYDHDYPNKRRIDRTIAWLRLPETERPQFISLYFSMVDTEGHNSGPNSEKLKLTVQQADALLEYLMTELSKIELPVNVILVSDHGMMELRREEKTWITLSKLFNTSDSTVEVVNNGTHAHLYTSRPDSLYTALKQQEENFKVYQKGKLPKQWHYHHQRVGDLLILANPGYQLQITGQSFGRAQQSPSVFGVHGFDPYTVKDMHGIFYAQGPNIKSGQRIPAFDNVHVYPLIAKILGIQTPRQIDGDIRVLEEIYQQ
jgi:predicted AlkP superfamily pyrophosphatase or phosphodiesterase